jgi:hypothetical protein
MHIKILIFIGFIGILCILAGICHLLRGFLEGLHRKETLGRRRLERRWKNTRRRRVQFAERCGDPNEPHTQETYELLWHFELAAAAIWQMHDSYANPTTWIEYTVEQREKEEDGD